MFQLSAFVIVFSAFRALVTEFLLTLILVIQVSAESLLHLICYNLLELVLLFRKYHLEFYFFFWSRFPAYCASFSEFSKDSIYCCFQQAFYFLAANFCIERLDSKKWFSKFLISFSLNFEASLSSWMWSEFCSDWTSEPL